MADLAQANPGTGGQQFRVFIDTADGGGLSGIVPAFTTGGSAGAWNVTHVSVTFGAGLPVAPEGGPTATSLSAVTSVGAGTALALRGGRGAFGMQVSYTSNPTAVTVTLEGTIDGTNWVTLATYAGGSGGSNVSGDIVFVRDTPVLQIRAHLTTLTGGTTPAVTATLCAVA